MATQSRTEITVETERVLIVCRSVRGWCQQCGREVDMVSLGEAAALTAGQEFSRSMQALQWHLSENRQGTCLVCLESLQK